MDTATAKTIPNYDQIKTKQQATWASGDYAKVGSTLQITGERLCESLGLCAGQSVLDVAAGNGNASLAAARRFCRVLSTDYVPELLNKGKERARAEGFPIEFAVADAEDLGYDKNTFDCVVSTFGVMFAPNQSRVAKELIRVCKPGGKVGLANWTPDSFIGELFKIISSHIAPPPGLQSPARWGTNAFITEHFSKVASMIQSDARNFKFIYESPQHWLDVFRTYYGPTRKAFEALDAEGRAQLAKEILQLIDRFNQAKDGSMCVASTYLETVVTLK